MADKRGIVSGRLPLSPLIVLAAGGVLFACSRGDPLPQSAGYGPEPLLPAPQPTWLPIVKLPRPRAGPKGRCHRRHTAAQGEPDTARPDHGRDPGLGQPVGVAVDSRGAVLAADDVGNIVWRIAAAP